MGKSLYSGNNITNLIMSSQKINQNETCCDPISSTCKVESIVSVDEKGRILLPKKFREEAELREGDKFALASWNKNGEVCCFALIKVENLGDMVQSFLGPLMGKLTSNQ